MIANVGKVEGQKYNQSMVFTLNLLEVYDFIISVLVKKIGCPE